MSNQEITYALDFRANKRSQTVFQPLGAPLTRTDSTIRNSVAQLKTKVMLVKGARHIGGLTKRSPPSDATRRLLTGAGARGHGLVPLTLISICLPVIVAPPRRILIARELHLGHGFRGHYARACMALKGRHHVGHCGLRQFERHVPGVSIAGFEGQRQVLRWGALVRSPDFV